MCLKERVCAIGLEEMQMHSHSSAHSSAHSNAHSSAFADAMVGSFIFRYHHTCTVSVIHVVLLGQDWRVTWLCRIAQEEMYYGGIFST